jgi:energy-coupling factor transporter transmembrane protein EcfT
LGEIRTLALSFFGRALVHKWVMTVIAVFFVLQFYFVRELLAAELLFGLGFAVLLLAAALSYLVGSAGERGLQFAGAGVRLIRDSARRGLSNLEINRKPFRLAGKIVSLDN